MEGSLEHLPIEIVKIIALQSRSIYLIFKSLNKHFNSLFNERDDLIVRKLPKSRSQLYLVDINPDVYKKTILSDNNYILGLKTERQILLSYLDGYIGFSKSKYNCIPGDVIVMTMET